MFSHYQIHCKTCVTFDSLRLEVFFCIFDLFCEQSKWFVEGNLGNVIFKMERTQVSYEIIQ